MNNFLEQLLKRSKSFLWRFGMMFLAIVINTVVENISGFNLGTEVTVLLGLVLGEVSKQLNNYISTLQ